MHLEFFCCLVRKDYIVTAIGKVPCRVASPRISQALCRTFSPVLDYSIGKIRQTPNSRIQPPDTTRGLSHMVICQPFRRWVYVIVRAIFWQLLAWVAFLTPICRHNYSNHRCPLSGPFWERKPLDVQYHACDGKDTTCVCTCQYRGEFPRSYIHPRWRWVWSVA